MRFQHLLFTAFAIASLASCSNDDDTNVPSGTYDNGVLVLNEGGLGEVTFLTDDLSAVYHSIFWEENGDAQDLGSFAQSMFFDGDRAFIISNGSNKITVVNRYTFKYIATISTGMQVPRYGVVYNGKAFVTNSGDFANSTDDFITVINLSDFSVEAPIMVNTYAERLIEHNGKLYVSGAFYGVGDKITVVNANSKSIERTITTGAAPGFFEAQDGILYVLCSSFTADSKLMRINLQNDTVIDQVTFPASITNAANLDVDGESIYFTKGKYIYKIAKNATVVADEPLINTQSNSYYIGYGFAVHNDRIYISEAADDFSSDGKVFVYSTSGNLLKQSAAGLGPNGFYFND